MEFLSPAILDKIGTVAVLLSLALAVITDKLVWHTRLAKAEARATRWEKVALEALTTSAQASVTAAEVAAEVVAALPDPDRAQRIQRRGGV